MLVAGGFSITRGVFVAPRDEKTFARIQNTIRSNNSGSYEIRETSRDPLSHGRSARLREFCLFLEEAHTA